MVFKIVIVLILYIRIIRSLFNWKYMENFLVNRLKKIVFLLEISPSNDFEGNKWKENDMYYY